jgi:RNA polymerase sigma factor (sigma-70 family)
MATDFSSAQLTQYWSLARRMAARWCPRGVDPQDAAQEVLLRLINQPRKPDNEVAWIYVVTRRICHRMHLTAANRESAEQSFVATNQFTAPGSELAADLNRVMGRLPSRDRLILQLVVFGVPAREIAGLMGCKTRDVGQLVTRARRKARLLRGQ